MRLARRTIPGAVHHVISRFVDRSWLVAADAERDKYLHYLEAALSRSTWRCLCYALMSSHLHLAMLAGVEPPESWTKSVNSGFALWMNKRAGRLGAMFAGRAAMYVVPATKVARVIAYVHNNPVRAGVVARASASTWTSHRAYLGVTPPPAWLAVDDGLAACGFTRQTAGEFDAWVDGEASAASPEVDPVLLAALGRAVHRSGGIEPATPVAVKSGGVQLAERPHSWRRLDPNAILPLIAEVCGVSREAAAARRPTPAAHLARRVALFAGRELGLSITDVCAWLGIAPQSGSRLLRAPMRDEERTLVAVARDRIRREVLR